MSELHPSRRHFLAAGLAAVGLPFAPAAGPASNYPATVLAKKPVAYWRLGEPRGPDAADATANGHTGTYRGTPVLRERGAIRGDADTAVKLDGNRSYVEVADHKVFSQPT